MCYMYMLQVQNKIGPDTIFLDQIVDLTKDGGDDQLMHRYLEYATSAGALSLQSLYFVLWANFAGLSMHLLIQPSSTEEKVAGKVVSNSQLVRPQLEALWERMLDVYGISVEERLFLVKSCFLQWFEVCSLWIILCYLIRVACVVSKVMA